MLRDGEKKGDRERGKKREPFACWRTQVMGHCPLMQNVHYTAATTTDYAEAHTWTLFSFNLLAWIGFSVAFQWKAMPRGDVEVLSPILCLSLSLSLSLSLTLSLFLPLSLSLSAACSFLLALSDQGSSHSEAGFCSLSEILRWSVTGDSRRV